MSARRRWRAALGAWSSFSGAAPVTRAFLVARLLVLPLKSLDPHLSGLNGRVLSVGAGHGLLERYVAELSPDVRVEGIEIDAERVRVAAATAGRAPRVALHAGDVRDLDRGEAFDAALAVDLLHHLAPEQQASLLEALAARVRPGGLLLVKDIATTPRWRWAVNRLHDRIVSGPEPIHCRSPREMAAAVEAAGFAVESVERLRGWTPYPHYLVTGRR